jgi:hypothetical protein
MTSRPTVSNFAALALFALPLAATEPARIGPPAGTLLFNSGFEPGSELVLSRKKADGTPSQIVEFRGIDRSVPAPNDWDKIAADPQLGTFRIYYEGGDESQRWARILPDEKNPANHVLRFHLAAPNARVLKHGQPIVKSRIQADLYGNADLHEFYQSVRVRFSSGFELLRDFPGTFGWLTLAEYWNHAGWTKDPFPFRITLGLRKANAGPGQPLYFSVGAERQTGADDYAPIWHETNRAFPVPTGRWLTLETYYREGNAQTGRYYLAVTPEGGSRSVIFDLHTITHHPDNPAPAGLKNYNPIKLYTSAELVNFVRARGAALEADWDDYHLWRDRRP